jgi:murein L,D-transpeptidase YcbB/YkuD
VVAQGLRLKADDAVPGRSNDTLVRAALDHARAVHGGRLDTADFQVDWGLRPPAYDPLPGFADAVRRDRIAAWFASLPPPYVGYNSLRKGLADYRRLADAGGWPTIPAGSDLVVGASGARVAALRRRLAVEDRQVDPSGDRFDDDLREAVRRAQRRYGLNPTGTVAAQTLAALNVSAEDRVRQIMANMERWRWLPQSLPQRRIQVNIAAAVLTVFEGDAPVTSMRAVTGRPGAETPMLESRIHSIVLNPPWNVPSSIATRELWPKERSNPGYLRRNGFRVIETDDGGKRLQQAAGSQSALGRYKFDFDNRYAVYLHDTPSQATFARYDRLASHGCVRLERPGDLARLLLESDPAWTDETISAAIEKGDTVRARLADPVAVYLLYWTAFASGNGQMNFRADPYDWDGRLATKIEARSAIQASAIQAGG